MKKSPGVRVRKLNIKSRRHSYCNSARLEELDWESGWWSDNSFDKFYLHVPHTDGETVHRVYCRETTKPRIGMYRGNLCWYVDSSSVRDYPCPRGKGVPR